MSREHEARIIQDMLRRLDQLEARSHIIYDKGAFTPAWVGTTIAGTFTYTAAACVVEWARVGNRLWYNGRILITAIGVAPTGTLTITGWPYAGVSDATMAIAGVGVMPFWALNVAAGYTDVGLQILNGASAMSVIRSGDNIAPGAVQGGELIVGDCRFSGMYRVA